GQEFATPIKAEYIRADQFCHPHFSLAKRRRTIHIRLVFFISTTLHCLPLRRATSSSVPGLWRDTWMVVMMMVMVVVMGMNNHHNLRLRRYRNCREAEDENQSKQ
ncbi:MAG: hypothetical protein WB679_20035, partial [Terracidiphilus sp.]